MTATTGRPAKPLEHGSETAYRYYGCRCDECRAGRSTRARKRYTKRTPKPKHGTVSMYNYRKCRCDACRAANSAYRAERRSSGVAVAHRTPIQHGTSAGYDRGCRCADCRMARSLYMAAWRKRKGRTERSTTLEAAERLDHAADRLAAVPALLEARSRALAATIARAPRTETAREARTRLSEVQSLLAHLRAEVTS